MTMSMNKKKRQEIIKSILDASEVGSQHELLALLSKKGVSVLQPTLSRDLHEMSVIKIPKGFGRFVYQVREEAATTGTDEIRHKFMHIVKNIRNAENLIIVKTPPGEASGLALVIDEVDLRPIMGTIAGDDTVLVVVDTKANAAKIMALFKNAKAGTLPHDFKF
jgi:transcriptional regulator of arginine metabolism